MTTTFLPSAMIAGSMAGTIFLFCMMYLQSERDNWDKALFGIVTWGWSILLIRFISEQWV